MTVVHWAPRPSRTACGAELEREVLAAPQVARVTCPECLERAAQVERFLSADRGGWEPPPQT